MDLTLLKVRNKASTEVVTREANMALGKILIFFNLFFFNFMNREVDYLGHPTRH